MNSQPAIWDRIRVPFVSWNGASDYKETFFQELNDQCGKIVFIVALIATFALLPYIPIDRQLHPNEPLIIALRIGFSAVGLTILILQSFKRFRPYCLLFLIIISGYLEITTAAITGLSKADPAYLGGYLLVTTLLALIPIPRRAAWSILALSVMVFFSTCFANGMYFDTIRSRYSLNDLLVAIVVTAFFIFLLDRLRFKSWEKSKKIWQQNQALRESEDFSTQLIAAIPDSVIRTNIQGEVVFINEKGLEVSGYRREEIVGQNMLSFIAPEDLEAAIQNTILMMEGPLGPKEYHLVLEGGRKSLYEVNGSVLEQEDGTPYGMVYILRDISERRQAEEALRESEEKYRGLFQNALMGIYQSTPEGRFLSANPALARIYGYDSAEELIGGITDISTQIFMNPDDRTEVMRIMEKEGFLPAYEVQHRRKDGSPVWLSLHSRAVRNGEGRIIRFDGLAIDISERKRAEEALRESEEKLRRVVETIPHVLSIGDMNLKFTYVSPAVRRMLGYTPEEMTAMTLDQMITPESMGIALKAYQEDLDLERDSDFSGHNVRVLELEQYCKDGSSIPTESTITFLRDAKGAPIGIVMLTTDITERKRAEAEKQEAAEALRRSEEKYRLLTENSGDVIYTTDTNLRMTYISPAIQKLRGVTPEEAMGQSLSDAITPKSLNVLMEDYLRVLPEIEKGNNPTSHLELEQYKKDGSTFWTEVTLSPMRDGTGHMTGIVGVSRDISERKRMEAELKEAEEKYRTILETMDSGYYEVDLKGTMRFCNPALRKFLGYGEEEELTGLPFSAYMDEDEVQRIYGIFHEVYVSGKPCGDFYWRLTRKDGASAYSAASVYPMRDAQGSIAGFRGTVRDITILKEAKDAADAASRSKSAFLANMSHEIRTPMNAILGFAQLMERDPDLSPQSREHLDVINRSGEHLLALINDILEMSKIEAGRATFTPNTFDLHAFLRDIERMFRIRTDAKKLTFLLEEVGPVPRWTATDEGKLRQILINLLGNAVKFTEEGGIALRVAARAETGDTVDLIFEVEDTGPGMTEEEKGLIFQAFEQTRAGVKTGGTGLGLALSRGFVQVMGGSIAVASTVGKGTTFRFEIPVREGTAEQVKPREAKRRVLRLKPGQGEIRVLVADDRETNRQLLSRLLGTVGFATREAVNGEDALRMIREWTPRVVLMDMTMPVMDGYEATRVIKATPELKGTAVIAVTASAFEEDRRRIFAAGADGYLSKPFKEEDLFENIRLLTGAEFLYDEIGAPERAPDREEESARMHRTVSALAPELVSQMRDAVESADMDLFNELAGQLSAEHPDFTRWVQQMAARYEYEALIELFSAGA